MTISQKLDYYQQYLNNVRVQSSILYEKPDLPSSEKVTRWFAHKGLSMMCLPANSIIAGLSTMGFLVGATTLGTIKVAIFAVTLGNAKLQLSTGCMWCAKKIFYSLSEVTLNFIELGAAAWDIADKCYKGIRWVAEKLYLDTLIHKIFKYVQQFCEFVERRLSKGLELAWEEEGEQGFSFETPEIIRPLNEKTNETRIEQINLDKDERPLSHIFKHTLYSTVNIPVNAIAFSISSMMSLFLGAIVVGKVVLYAFSNLRISFPTHIGQTAGAAGATLFNTLTDISTDVVDGFILLYKTSNALGLFKVVATIKDVVLYIPEAVFS